MATGKQKTKKISENQRFFSLVTVKRNAKKQGNIPLWECLCDCGQVSYVSTADLNRSHSKTCGHCKTPEHYIGEFGNCPEIIAWKNIKSRCTNVNAPSYKYYGGRGIKLKLTPKEFIDEIGKRPTPKHSVDRIDVNKHYEKGNIRWVLRELQQRNTRKGLNPESSIYKRYNRWISRISIAGEIIYLGSFTSKKEAMKTRQAAIKNHLQRLTLSYV